MMIILVVIVSIIVLIILVSVIAYIRLKNKPNVPDNPKIKHLNVNNFNQHISKGVSIVDFWAEWCMPCKFMAPILNELADDKSLNINVFKINVDKESQLAAKYNIRGIPTLIIFKNGKEVKRLVGAKTKDLIIKELKKI